MKSPWPDPELPSGLVTVASRAPVGADAATVTFAVSCVELTKEVEFTVIPVPENAARAPLAKPVPLIVTFWLVAPCASAAGLAELTVGAASTVNTPPPVAADESGLVTVTFPAPLAADRAIVMFAVSCEELTNVVELTVIPAFANETVAPDWNPVPLIVTFCPLAP